MKKHKNILKTISILAIFSLITFSSCDSILDDQITLKVPFTTESEFALEHDDTKEHFDGEEPLHSWVVREDINALIADNGGNPDKIESSSIKRISIKLPDNINDILPGVNINLVDIFPDNDLEIYLAKMVSNDDADGYSSKVLVATIQEVATAAISFNIETPDVSEFIEHEFGFKAFIYGSVNYEGFPESVFLIPLLAILQTEIEVKI